MSHFKFFNIYNSKNGVPKIINKNSLIPQFVLSLPQNPTSNPYNCFDLKIIVLRMGNIKSLFFVTLHQLSTSI